MNNKGQILTPIIILFIFTVSIYSGEVFELNEVLMRSTFKISEVGALGSFGTCFILGRPVPNDKDKFYIVIVTAAHVLNGIHGDKCIIQFRKSKADGFGKLLTEIPIRNAGVPLYISHPNADVSAMYLPFAINNADINPLPISMLADDDEILKLEIHPGDHLSCLGFPLGFEANEFGFPILRSGQIASYPLTPTRLRQTFYYDFNIFEGNSGGPVYLEDHNRNIGGVAIMGNYVHLIMGLVSKQVSYTENKKNLNMLQQIQHPLGICEVVDASLIKDTINMLPAQP